MYNFKKTQQFIKTPVLHDVIKSDLLIGLAIKEITENDAIINDFFNAKDIILNDYDVHELKGFKVDPKKCYIYDSLNIIELVYNCVDNIKMSFIYNYQANDFESITIF